VIVPGRLHRAARHGSFYYKGRDMGIGRKLVKEIGDAVKREADSKKDPPKKNPKNQ